MHLVGRKKAIAAIFGNSGVGEEIDFGAGAAHSSECIACPACVGSRAGRVNMRTEALGAFFRACDVWLARVEGDEALLLDKLVGARVTAAVA